MCGGGVAHMPYWFSPPSAWGCSSAAGTTGSSAMTNSLYEYGLSPRAQYLAMRNGADGRKAYCAYCGGRATWDDGKNCPKCGATETEIK